MLSDSDSDMENTDQECEMEEYHNHWDYQDIIESWEKGAWQSKYDESMKIIADKTSIIKKTPSHWFDQFGNVLPVIKHVFGFNKLTDDIELLKNSVIKQQNDLNTASLIVYEERARNFLINT